MIKNDPQIAPYVRRYIASKDFINNDIVRYCLWLKGVSPSVYRKNTEVMRRLEAVREMRLASSAAPTRALAEKPYLFFSTPQTDNNYLCIPEVSSERRRYIPIGFMDKSVIASNLVSIIPNATIYHFGILTSNVHMAWMRIVCGRLKSDYRYSGAIVYNNFPWPTPTEEQKAKIEETARPFWMPAPSIQIPAWPISTTRPPCPRSCAKPTSKTTRPLCGPTASTSRLPPRPPVWRN